jgi:hypothetical protein
MNCRRCPAEIVWLRHATTGKRAPIDAQPDPNGNIEVDLEAGTYRIVSAAELGEARAIGLPLHLNHFATCPAAQEFRHPSEAAR